jgi:pimeloyl-ACP methyl ester carboxylesterase
MGTATKIIACLGLAPVALAASAAAQDAVPARPDSSVLRLAQAAPARETAAVLRQVIIDMQRGTPDPASMEPALFAAIRAQGAAALIGRYGALRRIEFVGVRNDADVYRVTFQNAVTLCTIRLSSTGRVAGLVFKPAEGPEKTGEDVSVAGLSGTLLAPPGIARPPVVLLIAGSGPTDRNGNQGGTGPGEMRELAEALAAHGIATLRYDKRGVGRSAGAAPREQDLVLDAFVDDAAAWLAWLRQRPDLGAPVVAGHSEGGLIAILLAKRMPVAGIVLVATPGRRFGDILRDQLRRSGTPAPLLSEALATLAALERGETVTQVSPALLALFRPSIQPFVRSMLAVDPARELGGLTPPVMVVAGGHDLQVNADDAALLAKARPDAVRLDVAEMNHVLKIAPADRAGQQDAYRNPALPLAPGLGDAIAGFVQNSAH